MEMHKDHFWDEEWRDITFEGLSPTEKYQISNHGRVRHWKVKRELWKLLRSGNTKKDGTGYEYFTNFISKELAGSPPKPKKISKLVHRLVAERFCERKSELDVFVIHINHNKANNYYKNLKWVNRSTQVIHNSSSPRVIEAYLNQRGKIKNAKLTENDVIKLRRKVQKGTTPLYRIAQEFGITHTQLNRIRKGENWAHVTSKRTSKERESAENKKKAAN